MKFNTALGIGSLALSIEIKSRGKAKQFWYIIPAVLALVLGFISGAYYAIEADPWLDNFFVLDSHSSNNPGRMSLATALCMLSLAIAILLPNHKSKAARWSSTNLVTLVFLTGLISVFSVILQVPSSDRIFAFQTMALHTSLFFVILALSYAQQLTHDGYFALLFGSYTGSKLLRQSLLLVFILSLSLSYILMYLTEHGLLKSDFGIAVHGVVFILICGAGLNLIGIRIIRSEQIQKKLQLELDKQSRTLENFRDAIDASAIISITDTKGIITYVNENFTEISSYSKEELIGQTHRIVNSQYHPREFFKELWSHIGRGETWRGEIRNKRKDGSYYWVYSSIFPNYNEDGQITEYISIRQDITAKKEEELLRNSTYVQELEQKNRELEQFAYIASHDLQEPISTLLSFTSILEQQEDLALNPETKIHLDFIRSSGSRLQLLVKGLMDFANIGIGQEKRWVSNHELLAQVLEAKKSQLQSKEAHVNINLLPEVYAYADELKTVWQQLISNGLKFHKENEPPHIEISAEDQDTHWLFSVKDKGIGMNQKHLEKVFLIFRRVNAQSEYAGIGVGLAYCRKAIELHHGKIWIESEPNMGSIVYFTLPKINPDDKNRHAD